METKKNHQRLITVLSSTYKQNKKNLHQRIITLPFIWKLKKNFNALLYYQQRTNEIEKTFIDALPVYYHCFKNKQNHQRLIILSIIEKRNLKNLHQRLIALSSFCQKKSINALLLYYQQCTNEIEKSILSLF